MRFNDAVLGLIVAAFGAYVVVEASTFQELPGQSYGPAFFPTIVGAVLAAAGTLLTANGFATWRTTGLVRFGDWVRSPRHVVNFALVPACLLVYIVAAKPIGFIPLSLAILTLLIRRFGGTWRLTLIAAVVTTALIHTLFYGYLHVPLPWGLLDPIAW